MADLDPPTDDENGLLEATSEVATQPSDAADPQSVVNLKVPADIREKYEIASYKNAAVILAETREKELNELWDALRSFCITNSIVEQAGGNESEIPKLFSAQLRPKRWHETVIRADLSITLTWREQTSISRRGKAIYAQRTHTTLRERYLDGHKIDYVKNRVAFDLEWNSKDQTFDRDLYAFNAFFLGGAIDAGVLLTRGQSLQDALRQRGLKKYGASTTWWGKLIYRLNAGRNGGCPVLALGIKPSCVSDWPLP